MKSPLPSILALLVVLLSASICEATSIPIKTKSIYGLDGFSFEGGASGSQTDVDGIQEFLACPSSSGTCSDPSNFILLVVVIPNLTPGTVISFQGVPGSASLYCEGTSFLNPDQLGCSDPFSASADQQACVDSLNPTSVSGGLQIKTASCSLSTSLGSNSMTLIFGDGSFDSPPAQFATLVTVEAPTATPEPATLALVGAGLLGLVCRKRSRA